MGAGSAVTSTQKACKRIVDAWPMAAFPGLYRIAHCFLPHSRRGKIGGRMDGRGSSRRTGSVRTERGESSIYIATTPIHIPAVYRRRCGIRFDIHLQHPFEVRNKSRIVPT